MAMTLETALQAKTMMPTLTVDDIQKSITFFEGLGFGVEQRWEENGVLGGVMLRAGTVQLGLSQDDWKKGRDRKKGIGMRIYLETTQDIDALAARAKKAGIKLDTDAHDTGEGTRAFDATEPSGFLVTISSPWQNA
jgi:uncharacterized glyoxalase superfamily protein PhnB